MTDDAKRKTFQSFQFIVFSQKIQNDTGYYWLHPADNNNMVKQFKTDSQWPSEILIVLKFFISLQFANILWSEQFKWLSRNPKLCFF